jgi:N-methylhydantoinase A
MALIVAVDIGGTFTDFLGYDPASGRLLSAKSSSTPGDLSRGIRNCLEKIDQPPAEIAQFVHGSTVAINTVVEKKGAKTALVVTRGTRDVYKIGRGNRPEAYNIWFRRPEPLVPRHLTFEIEERLSATGDVRLALDEQQAAAVAGLIVESDVQSVAVCFLHSWSNPAHEKQMSALLTKALPDAYLSVSHHILREYGEYERTSTTVLNAYIGPEVSRYIEGLEIMLRSEGFRGTLLIMQSNGGVMAPSTAKDLPVAMLESGPVGGFIAAARTGIRSGRPNVIAFDMGGTTAKANLVRDGEPTMAHGYHIGGYASGQPMMLPVVDTVEVGAGGGSIARVDHVGALRVGPESAGAEPGPACYAKGGAEPTVTDANLILGRLDPSHFLGGEITLDLGAARDAIRRRVAEPLGLTEIETALAIIEIAAMNMSLAVRQISVERGYDPRDFAMVAFGGAGPLHAVQVARSLHIPTIIIPNFPGQFSASGMLIADLRHDFVRTYYRPLDRVDFGQLRAIVGEMIELGAARLREEHVPESRIKFHYFLDVRYAGQDFSLSLPVEPELFGEGYRATVRREFNDMHQRKFGYQDVEQPLEVVGARMSAIALCEYRDLPKAAASAVASPARHRSVYFESADRPVQCAIYQRDALAPGTHLHGPCIIQEYASTTVLFSGDQAGVASTGELIVQVGGSPQVGGSRQVGGPPQ